METTIELTKANLAALYPPYKPDDFTVGFGMIRGRKKEYYGTVYLKVLEDGGMAYRLLRRSPVTNSREDAINFMADSVGTMVHALLTKRLPNLTLHTPEGSAFNPPGALLHVPTTALTGDSASGISSSATTESSSGAAAAAIQSAEPAPSYEAVIHGEA